MALAQLSEEETPPAVVETTRKTYTVREAAGKLGVGAATLYRAIEREEVPFIAIGRRRVMPRKWVDAQLEKTA